LADACLRLESTAERLATFYSVGNAHLSIFLILGGFGLLLGTAGLGIVVIRNSIDSRGETALLRAVGYPRSALVRISLSEHLPAVLFGIIWGSLSSLTAAFPVLQERAAVGGFGLISVILCLLAGLSIA
jgi:hypothetical protein